MSPDGRAVYLEFVQLGNSLKATAIDPETGIEASVLGPLSAARADLQAMAVAKLKRRLDPVAPRKSQTKAPPKSGRGIVV